MVNILFYIAVIVIMLSWVFGDWHKEAKASKQQKTQPEPPQPVRVFIQPSPAQPAEQSAEDKPYQRKPAGMRLEERGAGKWLNQGCYSCSTIKVVWVSESGEERTPANSITETSAYGAFAAAGKTYQKWDELLHQKLAKDRYLDIYGREWLNVYERYPCFDSEDYLCEKRFYEWCFLQDGSCITRVFNDGSGSLSVTEDAGEIEGDCLRALKQSHYLI